MSVRPHMAPLPSLSSSEGALVSLSIDVDPRDLESLLEALARVNFPVNPQIYHDADMVYTYADGTERNESATLVEFPAYASRLDEVRHALSAYGFDPQHVAVVPMLDEINGEAAVERAPTGAGYISRRRSKVPYQP